MKTNGIFIVFVLLATVFFSGCVDVLVNTSQDNGSLGDEIVNSTVVAEKKIGYFIPLPDGGGKAYSISMTTKERGTPQATVRLSYSYWVEQYSSDRFGVINNSHLEEHGVDIGSTDDNSVVDRIFKVPENAVSSKLHIFSSWRDSRINPITRVNIVVKPTEIPNPPVPPGLGSIVNCSRYDKIPPNDTILPPEVLQPGVTFDSNGNSWFNLPGSPDYRTFRNYGYSYYFADKYTSYTFPANLRVVDKEKDKCEVIR